MSGEKDFNIVNMQRWGLAPETLCTVYRQECITMCQKIRNIFGRTANEILQICGQEDSVPVDLERIFQTLEISVLPYDFSKIEQLPTMKATVKEKGRILGAVITEGDEAAVFYSQDPALMSDHRYRFTIAHELAHCCLQAKGNHIEFRHDRASSDATETDANIFAGELLIPLRQLEQVSKRLLIPTIKNLADAFEVSISVMAARLEYLGRTDLYI